MYKLLKITCLANDNESKEVHVALYWLIIHVNNSYIYVQVTSLIDVPEEVCDLNPQKVCKFATKLVPSLTPKHECTIIPKETCNLKFSQPRMEKKPLKSEWCLDESPPVPDNESYDEGAALGSPLDFRNN